MSYSVLRTYCNICAYHAHPLHTVLIYFPTHSTHSLILPPHTSHTLHTALIYYPPPTHSTHSLILPPHTSHTLHTHSTQSTTPLPHTPHSPILPPPTLHTQSRRSWRWSGRLWALLSASSSRDCSSARWLGPTLTTPPELR